MTRPSNVRFPRLPTPARRATLVGLLAAGAPVALGVSPAFAEDEVRIVGGVTESRWAAVGALLSDGEWFCSGTAIGPRVVLTAAHCLDDIPGTIEFFIGADANQPDDGRRVPVASVHPHPSYTSDDRYDVGLVVLGEDVGVAPVPARLSPISNDIIGQTATFVGYGLTVAEGDGGQKRSVEIPISEVNAFFIGYNTPAKNTCNGDSGGPALMDLGRGLEVIGVTSYGDAGCVDNGYNTRSDVFASWIQAYLDGEVPAAVEGPTSSGDDGSDVGEGGEDFAEGDDVCAALGWYGDDVCDEDCAKPDPDCADGSAGEGDDWSNGEGEGEDGGGDEDDGGWSEEDGGDDDDGGGDEEGADEAQEEDDDDEGGHGETAPDRGDLGLGGCSGGASALGPFAALGALMLIARRRRMRSPMAS